MPIVAVRCRFKLNEQRGDVGRADPADPARLAERQRADALEFLAGLRAKLGDRPVLEIRGNPLVLETTEPLDLLDLPADVAVVLGLDRHLFDHIGGEACHVPEPGSRTRISVQVVSGRRRAWNSVSPPTRASSQPCRAADRSLCAAARIFAHRAVVDQTHLPAPLGEPQVGVVVTEHQPIFRAACEHAIRLVDPSRDQVVDQDADVRLGAIDHERRLVP